MITVTKKDYKGKLWATELSLPCEKCCSTSCSRQNACGEHVLCWWSCSMCWSCWAGLVCVSSVVWRLCCGAPVLLSAAVLWNSRLLSFLPWPLPTDPRTPTAVSADEYGRGREPDSIMRCWFCISFPCSLFSCFSGLIWELCATDCQSDSDGNPYRKCLFECCTCLPIITFPAFQGQL